MYSRSYVFMFGSAEAPPAFLQDGFALTGRNRSRGGFTALTFPDHPCDPKNDAETHQPQQKRYHDTCTDQCTFPPQTQQSTERCAHQWDKDHCKRCAGNAAAAPLSFRSQPHCFVPFSLRPVVDNAHRAESFHRTISAHRLERATGSATEVIRPVSPRQSLRRSLRRI